MECELGLYVTVKLAAIFDAVSLEKGVFASLKQKRINIFISFEILEIITTVLFILQ